MAACISVFAEKFKRWFPFKMELERNDKNKVLIDGKKFRQQQKENRLASSAYIQRK